jgi:hypothetical protein
MVGGPWIDPTGHGYGAAVWTLLGYMALHVAVGAGMALWCLARLGLGMIDSWGRSARIVGATLSVVWAKSQKVTTARTMPTIRGAMSASRQCRSRRRHHFARYANAAITRVWVPMDSVGSITGAKNSE